MTIVTRIEAGGGAGAGEGEVGAEGGAAGSGQAWLHLGAAVEPVWRVPAALSSLESGVGFEFFSISFSFCTNELIKEVA